MKKHLSLGAAGAALALALMAGPADARKADGPPPDTICTILGTADRYVDTTVTVRAVASSAGKVASLSDSGCQGSIGLNMQDESDSDRKRDVLSFRRAMSSSGARAQATVFGRFHPTGNAQAPYVIDVYSVRDVADVQ
ncbi:hypothetical protein P3W33_07575 [Luteibacter sp. PPL552]|jgi:hypothetical protein